MLLTSKTRQIQREMASYREDVINRIYQYNPENSFVEFETELRNDPNFKLVLSNNNHIKADIIAALSEAANRRISFLIKNDDKILEQYKEDGELLDCRNTDKMDLTILQMSNLVYNAELLSDKESSGVKKCCKKFAEEGSSIFASKNVLEYLEKPKNRVAWIDSNADSRMKYINRLYALMIVEHMTGDSEELKKIARNFPRSIYFAMDEKLRDTEKGGISNSESAR